MIWKILTFAYSLMFFAFGLNNNEQNKIFTYPILIDHIMSMFAVMSVLGICISLGWKKQVFTKKMIIFILIFWLSSTVYDCINIYQFSYNESISFYQDKMLALENTIYNILTNLFQINIYYIPFFIGLFKYNKNIETFTKIDKPIWKIFTICASIITALFFFVLFEEYKDFIKYNVFDYMLIFSSIYEIALLIGFSFNLQILNKLFWKITAVPYVIFCIFCDFLVSETFRQNFLYTNMTIPLIIQNILLQGIFIYALFKYTYQKENNLI